MYSHFLLVALAFLAVGSSNADRRGDHDDDDRRGWHGQSFGGRPSGPGPFFGGLFGDGGIFGLQSSVGFFQTNPANDPQQNTYAVYAAAYGNSELVNETINLNVTRVNATAYSLVESVNSTGVVLQNVTFQVGNAVPPAQATVLGAVVQVTAKIIRNDVVLSYNQTAGLNTFIFSGGRPGSIAVYGVSSAAGNFTGSRQFRRK